MADVLAWGQSWGSYKSHLTKHKQLIISGLDACIRNDEEFGCTADKTSLCTSGDLVDVAFAFASFYLDHGHYSDVRTLYMCIMDHNAGSSDDNISRRYFLNAQEGIAITNMFEGRYPEAEIMCREVL